MDWPNGIREIANMRGTCDETKISSLLMCSFLWKNRTSNFIGRQLHYFAMKKNFTNAFFKLYNICTNHFKEDGGNRNKILFEKII